MNDSITTFTSPQFGDVRTIVKDGEPWFVLSDLCTALGISQFRTDRLDGEVIRNHPIPDALGRIQLTAVVSEPGLYEVVIRSDKPEAAAFRRWVTSEVLPSIRKHGAYLTPATLERMIADPDMMIGLLQNLKAEQAKRLEAETKVAELAPKGEFYDAVAGSKDAIGIGLLAKVLAIPGLGQNNLFKKLRELGILDRDNVPHQEYIDRGYFRVIEQKWTAPNGETHITFRTLVFPKGQVWIRKQIA